VKLYSVTLTSAKSDIIAPSLKSVKFADALVIVDLGTDEKTRQIIKNMAGKRPVYYIYDDPTGCCAEWRNRGLEEAYKRGADFAVMIDTDERLFLNGVDIRKSLLLSPESRTFAVQNSNGLYLKNVFFRLPAPKYYSKGHVHEALEGVECMSILDKVRFTEIEKTREQVEHRVRTNDIPGLEKQMEEDPTNTRWVYYYGSSWENIGEWQKALDAYDKCASMQGPPEEKAWACFRAAICCEQLKRPDEGLKECIKGMEIDAKMAELQWMAGVMCVRLNRLDDAIAWSNMAIPQGMLIGSPYPQLRAAFKAPQGLFEGPFEVLEHCLKMKGSPQVEEARKRAQAAREARIKWQEGK
jgi:tetratricopeptide (TPR) repeat protein